jgi:hypothetical protein
MRQQRPSGYLLLHCSVFDHYEGVCDMPRIGMLASTSALLVALGTTPALAQDTLKVAPAPSLGFGLKAGVGIDPGQFVVGAQYSLGKALGIFRIVPNVHAGFGDFTTFDLNVDFLARLVAKDSGFGFYGGAAPTFAFGDESYSEFGLTLVAGLQTPLLKTNATNIEARFGIGDLPNFRILLVLLL